MLIKEDNVPRLKWPLGLILDVFPGKDGKIRAVRLKTAKGVFNRPVQKLYDLEIISNDTDSQNVSHDQNIDMDLSVNSTSIDSCTDFSNVVTRTGRVSKAPERLGV